LKLGTVLWLSSGIEVVAILALAILNNRLARGLLLVFLGVQFLIYHLAAALAGYHGGCPCVGSAWEWLELTAAQAMLAGTMLAAVVFWCG
jgi:hypothetical protein